MFECKEKQEVSFCTIMGPQVNLVPSFNINILLSLFHSKEMFIIP